MICRYDIIAYLKMLKSHFLDIKMLMIFDIETGYLIIKLLPLSKSMPIIDI